MASEPDNPLSPASIYLFRQGLGVSGGNRDRFSVPRASAGPEARRYS
ncbi:hypothetical protein ASAP_2660 [Asaia bogorensis]|uniref:Uncharacterized protein n=1 Tax=Asaia bogorensis TaxID=91915 RepID=A0A060QII0_9PROT|nr:hypothetical protein ASAP_2660 [Asaia bogorensis]